MCSNLSVLSAQNTDLATVAEVLASNVESRVTVLDRGLDVLASARVSEPDAIVSQLRERAGASTLNLVLSAAARNRRALTMPANRAGDESVVIAPVSVGEDVAGYLLTISGRDNVMSEDMRLLATEHAAMVCGIVLGRELIVAAAAGRARQELVEALLLNRDRDEREVQRWAAHLGIDADRQYYVLSIAVSGARVGPGPSPVEALLSRLAPSAIVTARTDEVVGIVPIEDDAGTAAEQGHALAAGCRAAAEQRLGMSAIGIGNGCGSATEIARSYAEARRALAAAERMNDPCPIVASVELGIHRLLLRVPDVAELRSFAEEVLGPLLEEDRRTGTGYIATLSAYFRENNSPRRAAQRLHVHPNTVSYRIRRAEEIAGLCFDVHRDRLMAEVAVEIVDGLGDRS
jgi:hypothetical protein